MKSKPSKALKAPLRERRDGLVRRVNDRTTELTAANEALKTEIAERKRAEALLDGERRVLEMIAASAPLSESLTALVRLIEEQASGMLGSILLIDRLKRHFWWGVAPSLPPGYVKAIYGLPIGPATGSCGTAAFRKESVVVEDIAIDPLWKDYRDLALLHGLRACWSTPILSARGELLGTFAMYYRRPALPEPEHWWLVEAATHIASIAICRERSESALRENEAKLKEAQRIGHIGYCELDFVHGRAIISEETRRIFGLPPKEDTGALSPETLMELIHPEDRLIQKQALEAALQGKRPLDLEFRIVRPDGEVRFVHCRDEMTRDRSGRPIRMFGTVQDVTDRKQAEELAKAREQEIRTIVEHSPDPIIRFDRNLRCAYVNPAFISLAGGSLEALLGRTVASAIKDGLVTAAPDEGENMDRALKAVLDTGKPVDFETSWSLPGGARSFTVHLEPEFDARGNLMSILSIGRDITERKRAEEAVRKSHQLLQQVLATLPVGVAVTNQAGDIVLTNAEEERIWGNLFRTSRERWVQSKGFWHDTGKMINPADWASAQALASGKTVTNDLIDIEPHGGQQKIIRNSAAPIRDPAEKVVGAVLVDQDVTDQKRSEDRLRQTEFELARVARLTLIGELTASISHEVNQPLAAVVTNANAALRWLAMSPPNLDEVRLAVQRIASDGNRASQVIQRIRALIKKREPARRPISINKLVQETVVLIQPELKRKGVSLKTELTPELPLVPADFVLVQQVLLNLIVNAIDSLSTVTDRPRTVDVQTNRLGPDAVQVAVQDTGAGIVETGRLFEPFYTTKPGGLGMGLAISRSIVEAHGGRLWATPNQGHGAIFQLTLPVKDSDEP